MNFKAIIFICFISLSCFFLFFSLFYRRSDKSEMYLFFKKSAWYAFPIFLFVFIYLSTGKKYRNILNGISMSEQLDQGFCNAVKYKATSYILGNSRCYRGINPSVIGNSVYNFAYDNETFLEQYYKLKYLKEQGVVPDTIILGIDYFEFSFVSVVLKDVYQKYFSLGYLKSIDKYMMNSCNELTNLNHLVDTQLSTLFGRSASQYFYFLYYHYLLGNPILFPYLKDNGQYIIEPLPFAKEGDFVKRDSTILDIQKRSFENIISFAKAHNVKLFLIMPPTRKIERESYTSDFIKKMDDYFLSKCMEGNIYYINYFNDDDFVVRDFMDDTHLTPVAADRFSEKLRIDIDILKKDVKSLHLFHY